MKQNMQFDRNYVYCDMNNKNMMRTENIDNENVSSGNTEIVTNQNIDNETASSGNTEIVNIENVNNEHVNNKISTNNGKDTYTSRSGRKIVPPEKLNL